MAHKHARSVVPYSTRTKLDLVGIREIAQRLEVKRATVDQWRRREIMPEPRWVVSGTPIWCWSDVLAWHEGRGK